MFLWQRYRHTHRKFLSRYDLGIPQNCQCLSHYLLFSYIQRHRVSFVEALKQLPLHFRRILLFPCSQLYVYNAPQNRNISSELPLHHAYFKEDRLFVDWIYKLSSFNCTWCLLFKYVHTNQEVKRNNRLGMMKFNQVLDDKIGQ